MTDIFMFMSFASVRRNGGRTTREVKSLRRLYEPPRQTASKKASPRLGATSLRKDPHAGDRVWPNAETCATLTALKARVQPTEPDSTQRFESLAKRPVKPQKGGH